MCCRVFLVLIGAVCICHQVNASGDVYVAELMIESNITIEFPTIQSVLDSITDVQVTNSEGRSHTVTLTNSDLVAECQFTSDMPSCGCADGYTWTNHICETFECCGPTICQTDVLQSVPFCIPKEKVNIKGSAEFIQGTWIAEKTERLNSVFSTLNGFEYINVTSESDTSIEFEVLLSVKFETPYFNDLMIALEANVEAAILINTAGTISMESPETAVCYLSSPVLKCTIEGPTEKVVWNMITEFSSFELNTGSVVKLEQSFSAENDTSCASVTLQDVTGIWEGTYQCSFTSGLVTQAAQTTLLVALLPDEITLRIDPLSVDCTLSPDSVPVDVAVSILNSKASYEVWWSYMDVPMSNLFNQSDGDLLVYAFTVPVSCKKTTDPKTVSVTFQNTKGQQKSEHVSIPVVYADSIFCNDDVEYGEFWPKASDGDTVVNKSCPVGRVGFKSRTCDGTAWGLVFSQCITIELDKVSDAADSFLKGLGATQEVALVIFEGLRSSSTSDSDSVDATADISASIDVLNVMARASELVVLQEDVLDDMVGAASNMLNKSWDYVNDSTIQTMSSNYLVSLEDLVKNIRINKSNGINSQNVDLKFCSSRHCNMSLFGISVNLQKTTGILKAVAVRNLMDKLRNNFANRLPVDLLISATLAGNKDSSIGIRMDFPRDNRSNKPLCVFWDTTNEEWSGAGCVVRPSHDGFMGCECNHLTSFSILMAKSDISNDSLDIITNVGLAVSICSLVAFLVIEWLVWSAVVKSNLSYFRHTALVNIAVFLLLADSSFLASSSPESLSDNWCLALTVSKHLFFLAMFSWMLCLSVMLVHQLIFVFTPLRKRVFMFLSSVIGYVCPILMVGSSYVYCKYTNRPYYNSKTCWLVFKRLLDGSIHAFLLPVGSITLTNLFSIVVVIVTLVRTSDGSKSEDKETAKSILKVVVFLTPVFGLTWLIGFGLLLLDEDSTLFIIANYSFTIFNSFQGLLILLTGCFAEPKVRDELFKIIRRKSRRKGDSSANSTSTTNTAVK
ncbi:adhesion G protein-coupled receptor F4 [Brachionichthys hirsutus]|uniref:adhesion G protein-coupled receptor F4 n=1 Tax=Brachionichthys hirsutus TaxID=412623 RepID=UPI0036044B83